MTKKTEKKLNNFYAYFPEGFYRQESPINYDVSDPSIGKIIEEIDRLIIETDFDIEKYTKVARIVQKSTNKAFNLLNQGQGIKKVQHYLERQDKFVGLRDEMIFPIFQQMISLGYNEKKLES